MPNSVYVPAVLDLESSTLKDSEKYNTTSIFCKNIGQ